MSSASIERHPPWQRITGDEATAVDRQWLRMLVEVFEPVSHEHLMRLGLPADAATALLGLLALVHRAGN